jgi:hypothetical protein
MKKYKKNKTVPLSQFETAEVRVPLSARIRNTRGIYAVKTLLSAKTLTTLVAGMLLIFGLLGIQNSTDTAQAAATGSVNLTNGWSNLSTAASPAKLAAGTTPAYVGSGKSLYVTFTSSGRLIQSGSNQLIISVVDSDLNASITKSTVVVLHADHSSSSTLISATIGGSGTGDTKMIPIIDTSGNGFVGGEDITTVCKWIGHGSNGAGSIAATSTLFHMASDGDFNITLDNTAYGAAEAGLFNGNLDCSTATAGLIAVSVDNAGSVTNNQAAKITISTANNALNVVNPPNNAAASGPLQAEYPVVILSLAWSTSQVNTTSVTAWSGVVTSSNAISLVLQETGRNTGVFEQLFSVFDNQNTEMPLGMNQGVADGTGIVLTATGDQTTYPVGSFGHDIPSTCANDCASAAGRSATSATSTLAVKDGGTVYVKYTDAATSDSTNVSTTVSAKVDATNPTVSVNSPAHSSENQTRVPTISLTATDAGAGLDVSNALLLLDEENDDTEDKAFSSDETGTSDGADVLTSDSTATISGNSATATGVNASEAELLVLYGFTTAGALNACSHDSYTCSTSGVTVDRGTSTDGISSLTYTHTPSSSLPIDGNSNLSLPVNHWIDFMGIASDLAGNVGFTDSDSTVSSGVLAIYAPHHIKIDQKLPSISSANTGWWWDTSLDVRDKTHKNTTTKATTIVVNFDGNVADIDPTDFLITFDDGTTHTPSSATVYDFVVDAGDSSITEGSQRVYLTLDSSMAANDTPKVALAGSVSDKAGNATATGSLGNATDTIDPTITAILSGGSGTGTGTEGASGLTKSTVTLTVTTDEELISNPTVTVHDLGMAAKGKGDNAYKGPCGTVSTCGFGASAIDMTAYGTSAAATDSADWVGASTTAQGAKSFTLSIAKGTPGYDGSKTVIVSATDKATAGNTKTTGTASSSTDQIKFVFDVNAATLVISPAAASTTTQRRPYIVLDYSDDLSKVTISKATLDGVDISGDLSTTDNKKFYYVPSADLTAASHTVIAKMTDYAGNATSEESKAFTVAARSDFKITLLAGWNAISIPSNPVSGDIDTVFSNAGVDQILAYQNHAWHIATKDITSGKFASTSESPLTSISQGVGYWVHNNNFESQAVALIGAVEPSAGTPPAVVTIPTVAGWNFVGVVDVSRANTQGVDGTTITTSDLYFGDLVDSSAGGHDIVYKYDTTNLKFVEVASTVNLTTGQGLWIYVKPQSDGSVLAIVPPSP